MPNKVIEQVHRLETAADTYVSMTQTQEAADVEHTFKYYTEIYPKQHAHVLLTQMNFRQVLQKFGGK